MENTEGHFKYFKKFINRYQERTIYLLRNRHIFFIAIILAGVIGILTVSPSSAYGQKSEAESIWEQGERAYSQGKFKDALSYYERSLSICRKTHDQECIAANLNGVGRCYEELGNLDKALASYNEALRIDRQRNSRLDIAIGLLNIGSIYKYFGRYEKSLPYLEESLSIYRELKDKQNTALLLSHLGFVNTFLGKYNKALSYYEESLRLNKELNIQREVGTLLNNMGYTYSVLNQYEKALHYYEEALTIRKKLNIPEDIASTLNNMGLVYHDLVKFDKALYYYEEAMKIRKQHNLAEGIATSLNNIGALYKDLSQYDKALSNYQESLKININLNNKQKIATNLNNIGNLYVSIGQYDKALSYYTDALNINRELNIPIEIALNLNNIGSFYYDLGQYDLALPYHMESLEIRKKLNIPHDIAQSLDNIGADYLFQKKYNEAEDLFIERRKLQDQFKGIRLRHNGLVEVYIATRKYDQAIILLKEIPPNWKEGDQFRMQFHTQYGRALKGKGLLKDASHELLKAVQISEDMRQKVADKSGFFAGGSAGGRFRSYRDLFSALAERSIKGEKHDNEFIQYGRDITASAFYFSEMLKSRTLLESIALSGKKYSRSEIPVSMKKKEKDILDQLSAIEGQWKDAYKKGEDAFKSLQSKKEDLKTELDSLISLFRKEHPLYASLNYPQPVFAEELPLKDNEVLIEYAFSENAGYVFVLKKSGIKKLIKIPMSRELIDEKVRALLDPFNTGRHSQFSTSLAKELYDVLLAEALKDVKDTNRVIIVPDGALGLLPFESLVIKEGRNLKDTMFAGDRWKIAYSPSATVLSLTRMLKPSHAGKNLFALGNPIYDKNDPRYIAYKDGRMPKPLHTQNLNQYAFRGITNVPREDKKGWEEVVYLPLPETEHEVKSLARLFNTQPEPPDILLNINANETTLRKTDLKNYRYIHFATHADLPGKVQGIVEPFLILGQVENKEKDDGFLTLSDVLNLSLDADMVVLSACMTGKGRMTEGEGVANFARAFHHAGARSVVVSLWEVASKETVEFMEIFYRYLKEGKDKAEALQRTKKEIKTKYPNPFFWAVFVLYGEGQ